MHARPTFFAIHFEGVLVVLVYKYFESVYTDSIYISFVILTIHNNFHILQKSREKERRKSRVL